MQEKSNIRPERYRIEDLGNGKSAVSFFDNIQEEEISQVESEETTISYVYDMYIVETRKRDTLEQEIEEDYETWLAYAKQQEYNKLAAEIREKRNQLLAETDSEMCLDRMGLVLPEGTSFTAWLGFLRSIGTAVTGKMAKYRQELRDITKQEEFPYYVKFPTKPTKKEE